MTVAVEATPRQIFPPLTPAEYGDLRESIQRQGVLHPILVDQHGQIIDGHHRKVIAEELMIALPTKIVEVRDEAHACEVALEANLRHGGDRTRLIQSKQERAAVVIACRERGMTQERIAQLLNVSQRTIAGDVLELSNVAKLKNDLSVVGADGRVRPARRPTPQELERRYQAVAEMTAVGIPGVEQARALGISESLVSLAKKHLRETGLPDATDRSHGARERRAERVRELAASGHTRAQMAAAVGVSQSAVASICKDYGIDVPADVRGRPRRIDSNRVVSSTVLDLEAAQIALRHVDYDQLDRADIEHWTASLSQSIRVLTQLNKRLKEMVQ